MPEEQREEPLAVQQRQPDGEEPDERPEGERQAREPAEEAGHGDDREDDDRGDGEAGCTRSPLVADGRWPVESRPEQWHQASPPVLAPVSASARRRAAWPASAAKAYSGRPGRRPATPVERASASGLTARQPGSPADLFVLAADCVVSDHVRREHDDRVVVGEPRLDGVDRRVVEQRREQRDLGARGAQPSSCVNCASGSATVVSASAA